MFKRLSRFFFRLLFPESAKLRESLDGFHSLIRRVNEKRIDAIQLGMNPDTVYLNDADFSTFTNYTNHSLWFLKPKFCDMSGPELLGMKVRRLSDCAKDENEMIISSTFLSS